MQANKQQTPGEGSEGDDYDPHLHRDVPKPTNNFETIIHVTKGIIGTGMLALPESYKYAGIINGMISTILIGILVTHCLHILVKSQYALCKKLKVPILPYPVSMTAACETGPEFFKVFKPFMYGLTVFFLVTYQTGVVTAYILFISSNVKKVIDYYLGYEIRLIYYKLMFLVPCLLLICIPDLKYLAPFSLVADIILFSTCIIIFYYVSQNLLPFKELSMVGTLYGYPLYFGTNMFAIQCPAVITAAENNMKYPKNFTKWFGALNISMAIVLSLYMTVATLGYWRYGEEIESAITLNFPTEEIVGQIVRLGYSLVVLLSIALNGVVGIQIFWIFTLEKLTESWEKHKKYLFEYGIRLLFILLTYFLAIFVPCFGPIVSLSGVFCLTMVGIAFPVFMEISVKYPDELGYLKWVLWKNILLLFVAFLGFCAGCYCNIAEIIQALKSNETNIFD